MLSQKNFKIGNEINSNIYEYDELNIKHTKLVKGTITQTTKYFVVIDNGKFKECFKYSVFTPSEDEIDSSAYDQSLESYQDEIVENCIEDLNTNGEGFVFNMEQVEMVINSGKIKVSYIIKQDDDLIYFQKI